jgi:hypothetical protein
MRQNILDRNKARTANSVYVAIAGEVVNRRSVLLINFVLNGKVSATNPLLHIHSNRCASCTVEVMNQIVIL